MKSISIACYNIFAIKLMDNGLRLDTGSEFFV